jgi:proteasome lid subunit RPN8/RPN11
MIQIHEHIVQAIIDFARGKLPIEACGYLAGTNGVIIIGTALQILTIVPNIFRSTPKNNLRRKRCS